MTATATTAPTVIAPDLAPSPYKAAEIEWLGSMIASLPAESYLHAILADLRPQIVDAIRNDCCFTYANLRFLHAEIREAQAALAEIRAAADEQQRKADLASSSYETAADNLRDLAATAERMARDIRCHYGRG